MTRDLGLPVSFVLDKHYYPYCDVFASIKGRYELGQLLLKIFKQGVYRFQNYVSLTSGGGGFTTLNYTIHKKRQKCSVKQCSSV